MSRSGSVGPFSSQELEGDRLRSGRGEERRGQDRRGRR